MERSRLRKVCMVVTHDEGCDAGCIGAGVGISLGGVGGFGSLHFRNSKCGRSKKV